MRPRKNHGRLEKESREGMRRIGWNRRALADGGRAEDVGQNLLFIDEATKG
jgi:hypothetical protein